MEFINGIIFLTVLVIAIAYGKKHDSLWKITYCTSFIHNSFINMTLTMSSAAMFYRILNMSLITLWKAMFVLKCLKYHFNLRLLITAIKNMIDVNIDLSPNYMSCSIFRKSAGHLHFVSKNAVRFVSFSLSATRNDCVNVPFSMLAHCIQSTVMQLINRRSIYSISSIYTET